jgi:hypothetical protein
MQLKALDQIHISSVSSETLKPGQIFAVSEALGIELLKKHPAKFENAGEKSEPAPNNKAEPAPMNKLDAPEKTRTRPSTTR